MLQHGKKAFKLIDDHRQSRSGPEQVGAMAALQLRVMGGFAAVLPTGQPAEVSGKKNQALLTYLALHADKQLTREKLIGLLWSDRGEAQARSSLRQALAALRRDLAGIEPPPLAVEGDTVALDGSTVSTDVA